MRRSRALVLALSLCFVECLPAKREAEDGSALKSSDAGNFEPLNPETMFSAFYEVQVRAANACRPDTGSTSQKAACEAKAVSIPKKSGGERILGVPTVADRVAQMVVKGRLAPLVEPIFHEDSFGYRPGKSAHQALEITRKRCWRYDWLLEFDIRGLFDNIPSDLLLKALRKNTGCCQNFLISAFKIHPRKTPRNCSLPRRKIGGDFAH